MDWFTKEELANTQTTTGALDGPPSAPREMPWFTPAEQQSQGLAATPAYQPAEPTEPTYNILGVAMPRSRLEQSDAGKDFLGIQDAAAGGRRGFGEAITDFQREDTPFIGSVITVRDILNVRDTFKKLESGAEVSDDERITAAAYWADMERKSQQGTAGMVGDILRQMPGFMVEIGAYTAAGAAIGGAVSAPAGGVAAVPVAAGGAVAGAAKTGGEIAARTLAKKFADSAIRKSMSSLFKTIAGESANAVAFREGVREFAVVGTRNAVLDAGVNAAANIIQGENLAETASGARRQLANTLSGSPESDNMARMMGLGDQFIEIASESSGAMIGGAFAPLGQYIGKKAGLDLLGKGEGQLLRKVMDVTFGKADMDKAVKMAGTGTLLGAISDLKNIPLDKAYAFLKTAGYHGMLEEMGEERLGGFMKGLLGIEGDEAGIANAFKQMIPNSEQLAAEAIAFAVPSVGMAAVRRMQIGGNMSRFMEAVQTVQAGARPREGVLVVDDTGTVVPQDKLASDIPDTAQVAGKLAEIVETFENNKPQGFMGHVANGLYRVVTGVLTGSLSQTQGPQGYTDEILGARGFSPLAGIYRLTRDQALKHYAPDGKATPEQIAKAQEAGRTAIAQYYQFDTKQMVVRKAELEAVVKEAAADNGGTAPTGKELLDWLNAKSQGPNPLVRRVTGPGGFTGWVRSNSALLQVPETKPGDPAAIREWALGRAASKLLSRVLEPDGAVNIDMLHGTPAEKGENVVQSVRDMGLSLTERELVDAVADPFSPKSIELASAMRIGLSSDGAKEKFQSELQYHLNMVRALSGTKTYVDDAGHKIQLIPKPGDPGKYRPVFPDQESRSFVSNNVALNTLLTDPKADLPTNLASGMLGFRESEKKPLTVTFVPTLSYTSKSASDLLGMFPTYTSGFSAIKDPAARERAAAAELKKLGGTFDTASGLYSQPVGAFNTENEVVVSLYKSRAYDFSEDALEANWKRGFDDRTSRAALQSGKLSPELLKVYARGGTPAIDRLFGDITDMLGDTDTREAQDLRGLYGDVGKKGYTEGLSKLANLYFFGFDFSHDNRAFASSLSQHLEQIVALPSFQQAMGEYMTAQGLMDTARGDTLSREDVYARMNPALDVAAKAHMERRIGSFRWIPASASGANKLHADNKSKAEPSVAPAVKPAAKSEAKPAATPAPKPEAKPAAAKPEAKPAASSAATPAPDIEAAAAAVLAAEDTPVEPPVPAKVAPTPAKAKPGRVRVQSKIVVKGKKPGDEGGDYSLATRLASDKDYFDALMRFAVDQYKVASPGYPVELDYNPADDASVDAALYSEIAAKAMYNLHVPGLSERLISELVTKYRDATTAAKADVVVESGTGPDFGSLSSEALADLARMETEESSAEHERGGENYDGELRVELRNAKDIIALSRIMYGHLVGRFGQNLLVQSLTKYVKDVGNAPLRDEKSFDEWRFGEATQDGDLESLKDLASYMDLGAFRELYYDTVDQHVRDTQVATVVISRGTRTLRMSGSDSRSSFADIATIRRMAVRNILAVPEAEREAFFRKVQSLLPYRQKSAAQATTVAQLNALSPEDRVVAVNQVRDLLIQLTGSNRIVSWFGNWVAKNTDNPDTWGAFVTLYNRLAFNLTPYSGVSLDAAGWRQWAARTRLVFGLGATRDRKTGNREPSPLALLWNDHVKRFGSVAERVSAPAGGSKSTIVYRDQLDNQADAMRAAGHDVTVVRIPGVVYETREQIGDSEEYYTSTIARNDKDMDSNDMLEVMRAARNSGVHLYVVPSGDKNLVVGVRFNDDKLFAGSKSFEEDYDRMAAAYLTAAYGAASPMSSLALQKRARVNTSGGSSPMKGLAGGLPDTVKFVVFDTKIGDGHLRVVGDYVEKTRVSVADSGKVILKALINGYDTSGAVTIVKSSMYLGEHDEGSSHKALADAVAAAGYFGYTDRGAAKEFSHAKKVEIAGLEGWEVEVDISTIGETTNLEHTTRVEERATAHPNMYDTAAYDLGRAAYAEYVKFLQWAQENGVPEAADLKIDDIDAERNRFEYMLRSVGVAEGFPVISENLRLSKLSKLKKLLKMPGYGAYLELLPALSPSDNKLTPAALKQQLASRGLFDFERAGDSTKPATFRADMHGNGVRTAYKVREGEKTEDGTVVDMPTAMRAVQRFVTAVQAQSEDVEDAYAALVSMLVDEKGQAPSAYVNFEDLVNADGSFDELAVQELPDGSVWFGGHKALMHRVPGGDLHAAVISRYWGPVQWVQNRKGTWVAGKANVIVAHPAVVARGGIDFDGDMANVRMAATSKGRFNRVLREEYVGKDVKEARLVAATRMFLAQTTGFEQIPHEELTAHINKSVLDVLYIDTPTGRKTIAQVKEEEQKPVDSEGKPVKPVPGVVALRDPAKFAEVTDIARAANLSKGIDVAEYRRMQLLLRQGVGFTPIGVTLPNGSRIVSQRPVDPSPESDRLLHRLHQNVLNIIMDDLSDPTTKYLGLDALTLPLFTTLSFGHDFKTWKDVIAFAQQWVDFSRSPVFAEMRKSIAANPFMTRDARLDAIANTRPSMARNANELKEVFAVNQQISAASGYTTMLYTRPSDVDDFARVTDNGGYLRGDQFKNLVGIDRYVRERGSFASIGREVEQAMRTVAYNPAYGDPAVALFPSVRRILKDQVHVSRNMEQKLLARIRTAPMADALTRMVPTQVVDEIVQSFYSIPEAATKDQTEAAAFVGRRVLRALAERQIDGTDVTDRPILDVLEVRTQADGSERVSSGGSIRSIDDGTLQQIHESWDKLDNVAPVTVKVWDDSITVPAAAVKPLIAFALLAQNGVDSMANPGALPGLISPAYWKSISDTVSQVPKVDPQAFVDENTNVWTDKKTGKPRVALVPRIPAGLRYGGIEDPAARRVAVVGVAFNNVPRASVRGVYESMHRDMAAKVRPTDTLVSGGSTVADHVAVRLFNEGKVAGLVLMLPGGFDTVNHMFEASGEGKSGAATLNAQHVAFAAAMGMPERGTLLEIEKAINKGAKVVPYKDKSLRSLFDRNSAIARFATSVVAYGITPGTAPTSTGTLDTWKKSYANNKQYVNVAAPVARPTMRELLARQQEQQRGETPPVAAPAAPAVRTVSMYFTIPNAGLREDLRSSFPDGVTTSDLMERGIRTASTRNYPLGAVGDLINTRPGGPTYRVTGVSRIPADIDTNTAAQAEWSRKEGWDYRYARSNHAAQVHPGAVQSTFELADKQQPVVAPVAVPTPASIAETLGGLSYDGVLDTYDQYTFQTADTPEYGASFYVPRGSGIDAVRAAMEAKRKAFRDAGSFTPPSFSLAGAENPEQLFSWISQVAAERTVLRATVRRAMRDAYDRAVSQYPYEPRKQLEVMLADKVWYDDKAVRNLDAGRQEAMLQALRKFNVERETEIHATLAGQEAGAQVAEDEARAGQPLESYSLAVASVSDEGEVALKFAWGDKLAALPDSIKRRQTLAQQLQRVQAPKDEASAFLEWTEGKTGDSSALLQQYEAEALPKLEIVARPDMARFKAPDAHGVQWGQTYEGLSVNKGQGEYKEYLIRTPLPVPGQHGEFQDPNLAGWFRVREYNGPVPQTEQSFLDGVPAPTLGPRTILEVQEIQSELFQKNKGGFVAGALQMPDKFMFHGITLERRPDGRFNREDANWDEGDSRRDSVVSEAVAYENYQLLRTTGLEGAEVVRTYTPKQATFLNLMLKDQTWVSVFVNAITQWARNQGFTKVRFPTGETAARVEGHQVLADRLTALQEKKATLSLRDRTSPLLREFWSKNQAFPAYLEAEGAHDLSTLSFEEWVEDINFDTLIASVDADINQLKTQGIEKLAPIEAFYDRRIAAIVNRMGAIPVTDASGNTWREVPASTAGAPETQAQSTAKYEPKTIKRVGGEQSFSLANSMNQSLDRVVRNELNSDVRGPQYRVRMSEYHTRLVNYRKALAAAATVEEVLEANQRHPEVHDNVRNAVLRSAESNMPHEDKAAYRNRFMYDQDYVDARYGVRPRTQEQLDLFDYAARNNFGGNAPVVVDHSLATAAQWRERLIAPYLVRGIPALHRMLRDEAGWYNKVHGRTIRWYESKMKEWGLFSSLGYIHAIKEQKLGVKHVDLDTGKETAVTGDMTRYSASPLYYKKYAGKFEAPEQQLVLLVHSAAKMAVEKPEGSELPDYKALKMKSRVRLNLPIAETDMLKDVVPPEIAAVLLSRKAAIVASLADRKASLQVAEYEHLLALKMAEAGIADFVVVRLPATPENDAPWIAGDVIWSVPVQLIEDTFATSTAKDKLVKAGRDALKLSVRALAQETSAMFDALHAEVNAHAPSISDGGAYLGYLTGYVPHQWGMGFLGQAETAVNHAIAREQRRVEASRLRAYEASLERAYDKTGLPKSIEEASDKQLRYMFELKRLPFHGRETALRAIKGDVHKDFGLHKDMTLADAVHEIHKDAMQVLTRRRARGKEGAELNAPIEGTDITDPLALTKVTGKLLSSFKNREFSARTRKRSYANFDVAYRNAGLLPNNVGIVDSVRRYLDDVGMQVRKEMWLNQAVLMQTPDGTPLVVPDPVETFEGENAIKSPTWESLLTRLSEYTGFVRDPKKTTKENLKNLIDRFFAKNPAYRTVDSGHASVARYYTLVRGNGAENVMDMLAGGLGFSGGEVGNLVKHVVDEAWNDPWHIVDTLEHANAWMKQMALLGSFFFPIAGIESLVAATGPKALTKLAGRGNMSVWEFRQLIRGNHPYATDLMEMAEAAGIEFAYSMNPMDIPTTTVQKDLEKWAAEAEALVGKKAGQTVKAFGDLLQGQSKFVFEDMFNTMKLWFVHNVLVEEREKAAKAGLKFSAKEALERWADTINDALGGQDITKYSYLTPTMRKVLGLGMFSFNWTLSAWNVAGGGALTGPFLKNYMSPTADKFIFLKNWPYMIALVMLAAPAMLQFITYAVSQALGGGDDDEAKKMLERAKQKDSPWIWKNEPGRQMYADITPLVRHSPFYKGEPTGDRRFYIHWGKQSWEIMGWFEKPYATFTSKLSQVARFSIEQATGETIGLGWDLGFKGMGLTGLVMDKEGEFAGSRVSHAMQKFTPFSFLAMAQSGDAAPLQMVGPVSKGVSFGRASEAYVGFLRTWAEQDTYNKVYKNKKIQANLEALGGDIIDAAVRNGYDPKKLIDSARSAVLKDYYGRLYKAIESKDTAKIEQISYSIARLNGTVEGVRRSIKNRNDLYGKPAVMSPEQLAAIQEAFINPRK